jgi:hypothetical protein
MYESRHFPAALCPTDDVEEDDEEEGEKEWDGQGDDEDRLRRRRPGVLLPFLDLLNHHPAARVGWTGDASGVRFWALGGQLTNTRSSADALVATEGASAVAPTAAAGVAAATAAAPAPVHGPQWVELCNNYGGGKGAEELLLDFGFADSEACKRDTVALWLPRTHAPPAAEDAAAPAAAAACAIAAIAAESDTHTATTAAAAAAAVENGEGPFELRRRDAEGRWEQFPAELWPALTRATGYVHSSAERSGSSSSSEAAALIRLKEPLAGTPAESGAPAAALLVALLAARIAPFDATAARDARTTRRQAATSSDWPEGFGDGGGGSASGDSVKSCRVAVRAACGYRLSQRRVLAEALRAARTLLEERSGEHQREAPGKAAERPVRATTVVALGERIDGERADSSSADEDDECEKGAEDDYGALAAVVGAGLPGRYSLLMLGDVMVEVRAAE